MCFQVHPWHVNLEINAVVMMYTSYSVTWGRWMVRVRTDAHTRGSRFFLVLLSCFSKIFLLFYFYYYNYYYNYQLLEVKLSQHHYLLEKAIYYIN